MVGGERALKHKLNHNRHLDYFAKDVGDAAIEVEEQTPTERQKHFLRQLCALCRENQIDPAVGQSVRSRVDYAQAIDLLIDRLNENGVEVKGNGKTAKYVAIVGEDRRRRMTAKEKIFITGDHQNNDASVLEKWKRYAKWG